MKTEKMRAAYGAARRILSDKGSDMAAAGKAIEKYRLPRDGKSPLVLHSATGTPILIVEALNAQVQRRMQVFRIRSDRRSFTNLP